MKLPSDSEPVSSLCKGSASLGAYHTGPVLIVGTSWETWPRQLAALNLTRQHLCTLQQALETLVVDLSSANLCCGCHDLFKKCHVAVCGSPVYPACLMRQHQSFPNNAMSAARPSSASSASMQQWACAAPSAPGTLRIEISLRAACRSRFWKTTAGSYWGFEASLGRVSEPLFLFVSLSCSPDA